MKHIGWAIALVAAATGCGDELQIGSTPQDLETVGDTGRPEPRMAGVQLVRGQARPGGGGGSPNLVYHGGPVMTAGAHVETIFWGTRWSDPAFAADKQAGLASFYGGMGNSGYDLTNSEYTDTSGGNVGAGVTYAGSHVDLSAGPRNAPKTSAILAKVCSTIGASARADGYYPVYVDTPRGHAGYCAWHSAGTCNGVTVQFAFFFNLDGDAGCDPDDVSGLHSQGLAALANVSGHELSEALTDPHLNAWYDNSGAENSDKCAWVFGTPLISFRNGSQWKIQGNWSNDAFDASSGYANSSGQRGCLDGGNFQ